MTGTAPRDSHPHAAGSAGLEGGLGVSSERTGPAGVDPADEGVQGTGTVGSATESTEGTMSTERKHAQDPAEGRPDVGTPGADSATSQPDRNEDEDDTDAGQERNTAQVPSHPFDRTKNPGHSHG